VGAASRPTQYPSKLPTTLGAGMGYVSAAAANNNDFNPANWNWKNPATYVNFVTTGNIELRGGGVCQIYQNKYGSPPLSKYYLV